MATVETSGDCDVLIATINRPRCGTRSTYRPPMPSPTLSLPSTEVSPPGWRFWQAPVLTSAPGRSRAIPGGEESDISEEKIAPIGLTRLLLRISRQTLEVASRNTTLRA